MKTCTSKIKIVIFVFLLFIMFGFQTSYAYTYYVATNGLDTRTPTEARNINTPWRTLAASVNKLAAGDILLVRGGTYIEKVWLNNSGTASLPITVSAYTGEFPVIDGNGTLPVGDWDGLLGLRGNYLHVSGLEVRNTIAGNHAVGVYLIGHDNIVSGLNVHNVWNNGILVNGDNCIVEDCEVWESCRSNFNGTQGSWASGLTAARDGVDGITSNAIMRRNIVYNNWGEGFSTYQANGTIMQDNIVYDNWAMNIYVSDATNVTVERNIVYNTTSYSPRGGVLHGITLADEISNGGTIPHSANMTIINNFLYRATISAHSWNEAAAGPVGLNNVTIAFNTVVNGTLSTASSNNTGSQIRDNIFTISTGHSVPTNSGITFSNNAWAATPPSTATGTGDYVGNAQVAQTGPTGPGALTTDFFKISSTSPVINHGVAISGITTDYFGITRSNPPDIGGHEYVTSTIAVTGVTLSPTTLALNVGSTGPLTATVAPANATNPNVTWSTNNAAIATVSTTGLVTAVAVGTATITVTTQDGGFTATCAVTVSAAAVNLALNKTTTVSSVETTSFPGSNAVDGSGTTRWSSLYTDPQWIYVDLGAVYNITNVVLTWQLAYATAYQIQVSNNATTWTNIYSTTTGDGTTDNLTGLSGSGRYVRMYGTARGTAYGYSLYEFAVYGTSAVTGVTLSPTTLAINVGSTGQLTASVTPANATNKTVTWSTSNATVATVSATGLVTAVAAGTATITVTTQDGGFTATCAVTVSTVAVNLALNKTVQVSSEQSASYAKVYAVDGIGTTRWSSTFSDPQWIYVDLGANYTINRVVLNWEAAYATAYQIQVSNDATTWTNIYNTTTGNGGIDDLTVSGTGRYVRMNGTARATAYGYSLYEFEVYGNINLLLNPGFEGGTTSWSGNSSTITQVATPHHLGTYGCSVTARTSTSGGPIQTVTTSVAANGSGTYYAEAWVMMASGTANMTITINYRYNNVDYYSGTTSTSVGTTWTKISGDIPILYTGTLQNCRFYIETTTGTASFYADDCMLQFGSGLKSSNLATAAIIDKVDVPKLYPNPAYVELINDKDSKVDVPKLYPNPATTNLTIYLPGFQKNEQMQIFNAVGKLTKVVKVSSTRQQINIEDLPNGIYIVRLTYSPNLLLKFIKQ